MNEEAELVICYGGAKPGDYNFADIVALDADILEVIAEREHRRKKQERRCRSVSPTSSSRS
jgi:hypothetical protein